MAKKFICITFLLIFSLAYLYAANSKNITLSIQGNGSANFVEGFKYALTIEASAAGYQVTDNASQAKYSIKFTVEYDRVEEKSKFIVSLVKVADSSVIVTMEYFFADEEEMMLYSQLVFFMLMSNLPEDVAGAPEDDSWRNKWLYFNLSFDYSLMFLTLKDDKDDKLIGGIGIYDGNFDTPNRVAPLDNKLVPIPGIGFGIEFQFLNFISIEPHAQISLEHVVLDHPIYNAIFSAKLKFPLKFIRSLVFAPYAAVAYSLRFPRELEVFFDYPQYIFFWGGIEIAVKAGKSGALFFDVNYRYVGDTPMINNYGELFPLPYKIHYDHSVLSFGIGYKFGLLDRKR